MPLSLEREVASLDGAPLAVSTHARLGQVDLGFPGEETQDLTHALHPYVAAINPPLARALIEEYTSPDGLVCDPFVGGGGVLVEAKRCGRPSIGIDVNPLAEIVTKAKVNHLPVNEILNEYQRVRDRAAILLKEGYEDSTDPRIAFWYFPDTCRQLGALRAAVLEQSDERLRTSFMAVLSATARDVMLTYRGEVRLRKLQGKDLERFSPDVMNMFSRRALLAAERIPQVPSAPRAEVALTTATKLPLSDGECDAVITSPPYADDTNGVGYFQFSRNMLYWLGYSLDEVAQQKELFLGAHPQAPRPVQVPESPSLEWSLQRVLERSRKHHAEALAFYTDYFLTIREMVRVTRRHIIVVIGNRVLARTAFDNGRITTEFMDALGVPLHHYFRREIRKKRIPNLGGDGGGISVEHILVFKKP